MPLFGRLPPATPLSSEERRLIDKFLEERGVTVCPPRTFSGPSDDSWRGRQRLDKTMRQSAKEHAAMVRVIVSSDMLVGRIREMWDQRVTLEAICTRQGIPGTQRAIKEAISILIERGTLAKRTRPRGPGRGAAGAGRAAATPVAGGGGAGSQDVSQGLQRGAQPGAGGLGPAGGARQP